MRSRISSSREACGSCSPAAARQSFGRRGEPVGWARAYAASPRSITRRIPSRFLSAAASSCEEQIVFERVASDAGVPARTVREYFQIQEDALVGVLLRPFSPPSARCKPVSHAKLYFFDVGVANVLAGRTRIEDRSAAFVKALEHLIFCVLRAWLAHRRDPRRLRFWRSTDGFEVDFVVGAEVAVEVKGSARIVQRDLIGMKRLAEETTLKKRIVVCSEDAPRIVDGVQILPVRGAVARMERVLRAPPPCAAPPPCPSSPT